MLDEIGVAALLASLGVAAIDDEDRHLVTDLDGDVADVVFEQAIGVRKEQALQGFITQMPVRFDTADEDVWLMGVAVEIGDDGLARGIDQILIPAAP